MALTEAGAALTAAQYEAQVSLRARILQGLLQLWPNFNPADIDASWARLEPAVITLAGIGRDASAALGLQYYRAFRLAEGQEGAAPLVTLAAGWRERATVAFRVTGPVKAKALQTLRMPDISGQTFNSLSGSVQRYVSDGGRDAIFSSLDAEREQRKVRIGWARVTATKPCFFCAMLASRGAAYTSKETADFRAHDHCACSVEPVYFGDNRLPGRAGEFRSLWNETTADTKGHESVLAFRRAYERGA